MIIKSYEIKKINISEKSFFLFYGENQGHKNEIIEEVIIKKFTKNTYRYDESEILGDQESFLNSILSKSFFENEKLIIISRVTDKIRDLIEDILEREIKDLVIILNANILEKKSKLRTLFEKNKITYAVPFYGDNDQTLSTITSNFFRKKNIRISQQAINLIVERSRGDRQNLKNELAKIESYVKDKKSIELEDLLRLTNLAENYNVSELIDSCLSKNKKKTLNILNENNYSLDDCILITRTFLLKSKRLIKLCKGFEETKSIDATIAGFKPPIFWKDKEIVKHQVRSWSFKNAENLIFQINEVEYLIKKYSNNSINILSNFIIEQTKSISN